MSENPRRRRGSGSIFVNEDGVYGIRYYDWQHRQRKELTGKTGKEGALAAERLLRKRHGEIDNQKFDGDGRKLRLDDLEALVVADHEMHGRPTRHVQVSFRHLRDFFGGTRALDAARRMPSYIAERLRVNEEEKKVAAGRGTVRREIAGFRRGLALAVRAGLLASRPYVQNIPEAEPRSGFATDKQIEQIITALPDDLKPLISFLALTGWRRSEGVNLAWKNVDFVAGEVRLGADETKNNRPRIFPMNALPELASLMKAQRARTERLEREQSRIIASVFHRDGEPIRYFGDAWTTACRKAGKPGLLVHDLRRSAARRMVLAGVPQPVAQKLLGHLTPSIFLRYAIVSDSDLADGVAKLARR